MITALFDYHFLLNEIIETEDSADSATKIQDEHRQAIKKNRGEQEYNRQI